MKLSIILPCYNEEENVPRIASELVPVLQSVGSDYEIIAVDDGSRDATVAALKKISDPHLRVIEHGTNKGLGAALRTGIAAAAGEYTIFMDSDFTFHPKLIPILLEAKMRHSEADFVIGSPNLGGYGAGIPGWRLAISKIANGVYYILLGQPVTSINQIFRLYKTADLQAVPLQAIGFDINAEILFKLVFRGKRFIEVPAELTQRLYGVSKLNYGKEIRRHFVLIGRILKWKWFGF